MKIHLNSPGFGFVYFLDTESEQAMLSFGCEVVGETAYGEDACSLTLETNPDIILMDIRLKGKKTGVEAALEIGQKVDTPIIFTSTYDYKDSVNSRGIPGFKGYFNKPVSEKDLSSLCEQIS